MRRARFVAAGSGLGLAVVAMATNNRLVTWAAIAALATALLLRVMIGRKKD